MTHYLKAVLLEQLVSENLSVRELNQFGSNWELTIRDASRACNRALPLGSFKLELKIRNLIVEWEAILPERSTGTSWKVIVSSANLAVLPILSTTGRIPGHPDSGFQRSFTDDHFVSHWSLLPNLQIRALTTEPQTSHMLQSGGTWITRSVWSRTWRSSYYISFLHIFIGNQKEKSAWIYLQSTLVEFSKFFLVLRQRALQWLHWILATISKNDFKEMAIILWS